MLEILNTLGALASIASLLIEARRSQGIDNVDPLGPLSTLDLTNVQQNALKINGSEQILMLLVIDPDLLDVIKGKIHQCIERYKKAIADGGPRNVSDVADKGAERCVCDALNRIKRRNDGNLPEGQFDHWWKSYRCIDDYDY